MELAHIVARTYILQLYIKQSMCLHRISHPRWLNGHAFIQTVNIAGKNDAFFSLPYNPCGERVRELTAMAYANPTMLCYIVYIYPCTWPSPSSNVFCTAHIQPKLNCRLYVVYVYVITITFLCNSFIVAGNLLFCFCFMYFIQTKSY